MDGPSRTLAPFGLGVLLAACSYAPPPPPRPSGPVVIKSEAADPLKGLSGRIAFISHGTAGLVGLADDVFVLDLSTGRKRALTETAGVEWHPDWSPDGSLIAFDRLRDPGQGSWEAGFDIHVMAADGSGIRNLTRTPGLDWLPDWSPDGDRIAFISGRDGNLELYTMQADGTRQTRLTRTKGFESTPRWSPDGERIVYAVQGNIGSSLWVMDGDGTGARRITDDPGLNDFPAWSPDGEWIVFVSDRGSDSEGGFDLYRIRPDGSAVQRLTTGVRVDRYAAWSPDGRWIVYAATPEGASALYVMPAEGGQVRQLTPPGSLRCCPSWIDEG